jgi:hypothetical protein
VRDPNRITEILTAMYAYWRCYPDGRLGQLICNLANKGEPFYMEDWELLRRLQMGLQQARKERGETLTKEVTHDDQGAEGTERR